MNKDKSMEVLKAFGNPVIKGVKTNLVFSRQSQEDVNSIEAMSDEDLIQEWKNLNYLNYIIGQVSLNDLQRIDLIELEINERESINKEELANWYKESEEKFDISQF